MGVTFALGGPAAPSLICGSQNTVFTDFYGSWPMPKCPPLYGTTNLGPFGYPSWLGWGYHSTPTGFPTIDAALHGQFWLALDTLLRMVIPALLLAFVAIAVVFRYVRYHPTDRMDFEFLRRARALGLPESKVFPRQARRYAFSATLPALTLAVIWVFMFLWVVEILFGLYGLGPLFFGAAAFFSHADYATLYGLMLLFAYLLVGTDIFAGSLRAYLDPRFRTT
jgi:peptide/nickel transport system permease protein